MDRDYYLKGDEDVAKVREAYRKHLSQVCTLVGLSDCHRRAAAVYELELKLAQAHWSNVENRDPAKLYNPMSLGALKSLAPQFSWDDFLTATGIPPSGPDGERQVIVAQLSAVPMIAKIFAETPVAVWRDYMVVHYIDTYSAFLPKTFDDATFAFFGTVLQGRSQQLPRTARAAQLLGGQMGFGLGKLYVEKYFPPEAQAKIVALVHNLIEVYKAEIGTLAWMSEATRAKALDKLHQMAVRVGYPARWRDYSALVIRRDDLIGNVERANAFEWQRNLGRLDNLVDRNEWDLPPQTVNAEYDPSTNSLEFFAAFLQPPYFDPQADDAVNYGAIGSVIGHEISHAFDDEGSRFDASGALNDWWTPADRQAFAAKAKMLGAQYDAFEPLPGLRVNGALTMGENIADNAGVSIALKAYHLSLGGRSAPVLDGYTGDQRFFLAYAQAWRSKEHDSFLRQRLLSDVHAPDAYRVIGVTRNQDAWYEAFGVEPGDKYYLPAEHRVHMW
jgi:putative endopeptidase